jgi:hypothetical protein
MYSLVVGTFEAENQAIEAERKLLHSCVPSDRVRTILPGSRKRLAQLRAEGGHAPGQPGGILVAVKALDNVCQALAVKVLREHGARDIERLNAERRARPRPSTRKTLPSIQYALPL